MTPAVPALRTATAAEWDRAWAGDVTATFSQARWWTETWCAVEQGRLRSAALAAELSGGRVAVFAAARQPVLKGLGTKLWSCAMGTYGGWLCAGGLSGAEHEVLEAALRRHVRDLWWRRNPFDEAPGGAGACDTTQALDLTQGFDEVLAGLSRGHRAAVNRARREGVQVRLAHGEQDWRRYLALYDASLQRWQEHRGLPPRLFDLLAAWSDDKVTLAVAEVDGHMVAGAVCLHAPAVTSYWHGAAARDAFGARAPTLLMLELARRRWEAGDRWFDLGPSMGLAGVREFKRRFGAVELPCPVVEWSRGPAPMARRLLVRLRRLPMLDRRRRARHDDGAPA